jgi:hypothetical protein
LVQEEEYQRDHRRQREAIRSADQYGWGFRNTQRSLLLGSDLFDVLSELLFALARIARRGLASITASTVPSG